MILSGKAKLAGVLGWPVGHSRSPRLHGYWLDRHGIDGAYLPLPVRPQAFGSVLAALVELGFRGVNVTVPHKQAALTACHEIDPDAERIGAVNTVVISGGRTRGSNSDGYGFLENLRQGAPGWQAASGPAVVLGAGGAARAVVAALLDAGAPEIRLVNRTRTRAEALAKALGRPLSGPLTIVDWSERQAQLQDAAVLVNTTTLGMAGGQPLDLDLDRLPGAALVNDIVYTPLETPLLAAARARGNPVVDGLGMLLHQARPGFAAWFGVEPEVTEELRRFVLAE
ncbi:MAG: shikimate dehydrogenase [Rhodospirillales bacterium]|nr:shikimate dehydrogenase [Rhodospirillales bacterium]